MRSFFKKCVTMMLKLEAQLMLARHRPRIVAITGTVGKTSTKDAVFCALTPFFAVRKSEKSFNNDFGIPLTILGLPTAGGNPLLWFKNIVLGFFRAFFSTAYPEWLVLEVGAGEPGDIKKFSGMLSPNIAVITRFSEVPVHVEFFASPEALISEKRELAKAVKADGVLILGGDDEKVLALKSAFPDRRTILYGTSTPADVRGSDYTPVYENSNMSIFPVGVSFTVHIGAHSFPIALSGVLGAHLMQPVLAAFSVASALSLNISRVAESFRGFVPPPGRMRLIQGANSSLIIDDSYNASPVAMREALTALASFDGSGRKIAVLGTMAELGGFGPKEHQKIGALVARFATKLVIVGTLTEEIRLGALRSGMSPENIRAFGTSKEAADALARDIRSGDAVLVKGSQSVHMERIVKALMQEPVRAKELLVRQESEWRDK
ncbi:MAG TPA: hypothetical protein DEF00_02700 [Candidatus Taylorbacteria bacterium]|nr:hypothetical protein [Candidatus Taylorbacteria bacterium]